MSALNTSQSTTVGIRSPRRCDIDWLRVLAMLTIFLYHSGRPFVPFEWAIMNPTWDPIFTVINVFVTGWIMPLFFVISGMATYYSLTTRNPGQYAKSRFKRLMIPFILALFIILPVDRYYDWVFHGYSGSFLDFYVGMYFTEAFPFTFNLSSTYLADSDQGLYLWYLFWLFVFSLITVHFFKYLRTEKMKQKISTLAAVCNQRGGIFLLAIPLILVDLIAVRPFFSFPSDYGGWKLPSYLVFFILAYVLVSDAQFEQSIERNEKLALGLGIITSLLIIVLFATFGEEGLASLSFYVLFSIIWAFNGWCWIIVILSLGHKRLNFNHKYLNPANELVLPFYVLHETVIIVMAFYVVGLNVLLIVKYLLIVITSFTIISMLLVPIKQINILRFLFGLKPKTSANP